MNKIEFKDQARKKALSVRFGLIAGILMAAVLVFLEYFLGDSAPYLKLLQFVPLFICIALATSIFKQEMHGRKIFVKGFDIGFRSSLVAGSVLFVLNVFLFIFADDLAFSVFAIEPHSIGQAFIISSILLFATIAFGVIFSFVNLTYLKESVNF